MLEFISELWVYLRTRKRFWLLPLLIVLFSMAGLIVVAQGTALAPFIYTLF